MSFEESYRWLDKVLHAFAFNSMWLQEEFAGVEDKLFASRLAEVEVEKPIFITALPRAGTTLLLELFARVPGLATHTYRQMPFLLTPLLWERFSTAFRVSGAQQERAHQDGMMVGYDSPEAFEEVLWRYFWKEHYQGEAIKPWTENDRESVGCFWEFFKCHMKKITLLQSQVCSRYVSKNNVSMARLGLIKRHIPDAVFLIPFRNPLAHVSSLLRQHRHFLEVHRKEPFTRRYMSDLGHHEFGTLLQPIDFSHWTTRGLDSLSPDYWMMYWCSSFEALLDNPPDDTYLLSYEMLCENPVETLTRLEYVCELPSKSLSEQASMITSPSQEQNRGLASDELVERAFELHQRLLAQGLKCV